MTFDEYQTEAARTSGAGSDTDDMRLAIAALGVAGEAGEVADYIKKVVGHGHALDATRLAKEIGDCLWYCAELCNATGLTLGDVARLNIAKLRARYPDGFDPARSQNRAAGDV
jgi:NTP pyrophosphatase (non-canonical NTP hydrolase)